MSKKLKPEYPFSIRLLSEDDGGGYLIEFPDLPGCMSDGETIEETVANGRDAVECWVAAAKEAGRTVPTPNHTKRLSGRWVQRVPKSLHARLAESAQREGVSLNSLVIAMLSEAVGTNHDKNKH